MPAHAADPPATKSARSAWLNHGPKPVSSGAVTLDRRRKPPEKPAPADSDDDSKDELRQASEEARRDVSQRAAELLTRLRKL